MFLKTRYACMTIVIVAYLWLNYVKRGPVYESKRSLTGKTVLLTGGNAGIGRVTALELAKKGARIIIASRNMTKSEMVQKEITKETGNKEILSMHLDLSDFDSVRSFVKKFDDSEKYLDYLINNAGVLAVKGFSKSGTNKMYAINHFGPFLLTNLLLDKMKAQSQTRPVRIINLSSEAYKLGTISKEAMYKDVTDGYGMFFVYSSSKLANIYFTHELNKRLKIFDMTTYAVHPGMVKSELVDDLPFLWRMVIRLWNVLLLRDTFYGIQTTMYCVLDDDAPNYSGGYFSDFQYNEVWSHATNESVGEELWNTSLKLTGLFSS